MIKYLMALSVLCISFFSVDVLAQNKNVEIDKISVDNKRTTLKVKGELTGYDKGATLTLRDADNLNVVLHSQVVNHKRFNAKVSINSLVYLPCNIAAVINNDLSQIDIAQVEDTASCGGYSATISGLVTDEPIPYATVSVTINGNTFTTVADENGAYSLTILSTTIDNLIKVESSAVDAQTGDEINFVNLVGSFEKVIDDDVQNVTNVTTASYVLTVQANGGEEPTTVNELKEAETAVDASQLIELAAVIKLIVDDPNYQLPEGFDSVIDFVSAPSAVDSFIENTPEEDLVAAQNAILQDSNLVAGFKQNDIPNFYYAIDTAEPGYLSRSGSALKFNPAGAGNKLSFLSWNGQAINAPYTWQIVNGRIEVTYNNPLEQELLTNAIEDLTDDQAEIDAFYAGGGVDDQIVFYRSTIAENFTRVVDGNLVDVINVETRSEVRTPTFQLNDGSSLTLQDTKIEIASGQQTFRSDLDIEPVAFNATCTTGVACVLGQWGGQYNYSEGKRAYDDYIFPTTSYADVITFDANGIANGKISGINANWQVDNAGKLIIEYPNGTVQTSEIIDQLGLEYGVFTSYTTPEGEFATYDIWVKGQQNFVLDSAYLQPTSSNHYWNGEINSWIPGSFDSNGLLIPERLWGWLFTSHTVQNIDGVAWQGPDQNGLSSINFVLSDAVSYQVGTQNIEINRLPFAKRFWYPIASTIINGDRVFYIVEREERDAQLWFGGQLGYNTFIPSRINIEREVDRANYTNVAR
ncbi:carboxypeptidase-like regulatory domain-containing protein [Pseudoalteromonas sp. G4]|uniref:carboxypeptidase-like regulatory domain-containing protein n=1 Tax=Pseudoalteromonas sp. G4 TaxID=2992761 RepID=UPI00237E338B|nr:carboxypeptidase-like regulatory domain-containing protein [Pseudoalteromonas sp. G4]MDE3270428.1 carboxypeptidase-like regulatory domain-containing protein [Pseudoalteromonas sp. G4]